MRTAISGTPAHDLSQLDTCMFYVTSHIHSTETVFPNSNRHVRRVSAATQRTDPRANPDQPTRLSLSPTVRRNPRQASIRRHPSRTRQFICSLDPFLYLACRARRSLARPSSRDSLHAVLLMAMHIVLDLGAVCNVYGYAVLGEHWPACLCGE